MEGQREFVWNGLHKLNVDLSEDAYEPLFYHTAGDKYLTQAICLGIVGVLDFPEGRVIANREVVERAVREYIDSPPPTDELRLSVATAISSLAREQKLTAVRRSIGSAEQDWFNLPTSIRAELYRNGLVRRKDQLGVALRAPIILDLADRAMDRLHPVRELMERRISVEGSVEREELLALVNEIEYAAVLGNLATLHAGYGRKMGGSTLEVEATALGQGDYSGSWNLPSDDKLKLGGEVWCILFSVDIRRGRRRGEVATFRVKEP